MAPTTRQASFAPPPASTVVDRLKRARLRRFEGRAAELELFLGALAAPEPQFRPGRGSSSERETATLAVQPAPDARAEPPQTFPFPDPSPQARKQTCTAVYHPQ
jgi:hypothetical protein